MTRSQAERQAMDKYVDMWGIDWVFMHMKETLSLSPKMCFSALISREPHTGQAPASPSLI